MTPSTTRKGPKLQRQDKRCNQEHQNMTKLERQRKTAGKYSTTRTIHGGETRRQIDYVAINAKYRETVRIEGIAPDFHADMRKNQRRRVQTVQLCYIRKIYTKSQYLMSQSKVTNMTLSRKDSARNDSSYGMKKSRGARKLNNTTQPVQNKQTNVRMAGLQKKTGRRHNENIPTGATSKTN